MACRVLGFSKQAFYAGKPPVTERDWSDAHLINAAMDVHRDDPAFGYRFIADELCSGHRCRRDRVARLCSSSGSGPFRQEARPYPQSRPAGAR